MSETIQTKRCSKCKQIKPFSEFFKDRTRKDGLRHQCKICKITGDKMYQQSSKGKSAKKRYNQSEKGKAAQKRYNKSEKREARDKRFHARHPNHIKAKSAVRDAIQAGKLPRPNTLLCHYCPKPAQQYHHWHGYEPEHWLDVVPVCIKCHNKPQKQARLSGRAC